jgi:hypothetical protein
MAFEIKRGDNRPIYMGVLMQNFGTPSQTPIDLTNADVVFFIMRLASLGDVAPHVRAPVNIEDAPNGVVAYEWQPGNTDTPGVYNVEFEINWADGGIETVPNDSYVQITIVEDLDAS